MTYHLLYESCPWHSRAALFDESGRLLTLRVDDASRRLIEGAVVWGRVRAVEKSLGAAFVDIGDVSDGFLPLETLPHGNGKLTVGQPILVRVTRGGFAEKGARLDARVAAKPPAAGTKLPMLVTPPPSCLQRALHDAGAHPVICWIPDARLRDAVRHTFTEKAIRQMNEDLPDDGGAAANWFDRLDDALDEIYSPAPRFPFNGGKLIVEITSAVATIDIDAGPAGKMGRAEALLALNLAAAEEVARVCRLLDLGGSVITDFITPRSKAHRQIITDHLQATFQTTDEKFVEIRPMSRFGLLELSRERTGPSMPLLLKQPSYVAGRILLQLWRQAPGTNPQVRQHIVQAHAQVISHLKHYLTATNCLTHLGRPVMLNVSPLADIPRYSLSS